MLTPYSYAHSVLCFLSVPPEVEQILPTNRVILFFILNFFYGCMGDILVEDKLCFSFGGLRKPIWWGVEPLPMKWINLCLNQHKIYVSMFFFYFTFLLACSSFQIAYLALMLSSSCVLWIALFPKVFNLIALYSCWQKVPYTFVIIFG